jgi:ribosomal-protein-serine acetyltransferase
VSGPAGGGEPLPERIEDPALAAVGLEVRTWRESDVPALAEAIAASVEHLRPFMPWVAQEPLPEGQRRAMVLRWEAERVAGGDAVYGILRDGRVLGGTGAHRRIGPDGLELGYWIRVDEQGRGTVTAVVGALTRVLLALPRITHVEIRMDEANRRSAALPARCGYRLIGHEDRVADTPGETGRGEVWRIGADPQP